VVMVMAWVLTLLLQLALSALGGWSGASLLATKSSWTTVPVSTVDMKIPLHQQILRSVGLIRPMLVVADFAADEPFAAQVSSALREHFGRAVVPATRLLGRSSRQTVAQGMWRCQALIVFIGRTLTGAATQQEHARSNGATRESIEAALQARTPII